MTFIVGSNFRDHDAKIICQAIQDRVNTRAAWQMHHSDSVCLAVSPGGLLFGDSYDGQPLLLEHLRFAADLRLDNRGEVGNLLGWDPALQQGNADSAFFAAAWLKWGAAALDRLVGGFAAAIWDERDRSLTLVRDHVGERPLYYLQHGELLAFASLPMPLRAVPGVNTRLNEEHLMEHLSLLTGDPHASFFRNIQKLPPGHILTFKDGRTKLARYWHPLDAPETRFKKDEEYVEAFRETFDLAVQARLRTTGQVGSSLSGGMDSSSVTAVAARLLSSGRLTAFTAVPSKSFSNLVPFGSFGDEGPAAAQLAAMYPNIDHMLVDPSNEDLLEGVEGTGRSEGEPVFNPLNQMWIGAMLREARQRNITALLTGACGNTTLSNGGLIGLSELFRKGNWVKLAKLIYRLRNGGYTGYRLATSFALAPITPDWLRRQLHNELKHFNMDFSPLRADLIAQHHLRARTAEEMFAPQASLKAYRKRTFEYYDAGAFNGATTLEYGIEMRDPTQDKRIFEFCFSIPVEQYLVGGQTRSLVRRAMRGRVPDAILNNKDRGLQSADWYLTMGARLQSMKDELARIRTSPMANHLLDLDRLQYMLENWPTKGFERAEIIDSWHYALTRGLAAGNFIRQFE